jgi:hypothetical protein
LLLHCDVIPGPESLNLERHRCDKSLLICLLRCFIPTLDRAGQTGEADFLTWVDVDRIVVKHGCVVQLQKSQRGNDDVGLKSGVAGCPQRSAKRERNPQRPRRADLLGVFADKAELCGRYTASL